MVIIQFAFYCTMPQPITSKLAVVAGLMDQFVRSENEAYQRNSDVMAAQYRALLEMTQRFQERMYAAERRISELEFDLRDALDHNERLIGTVYNLENSILECETHPGRDIIFSIPPPVARRLDFDLVAHEVIELSSDSDDDSQMTVADEEVEL